MKIDINLKMQSDGKDDNKKNPKKRSVWPTQILDDDINLVKPRVAFFDGATERIVVTITIPEGTSDFFYISGDKRDFFRECDHYPGMYSGNFSNQPIYMTYREEVEVSPGEFEQQESEYTLHCHQSEYNVENNRTKVYLRENLPEGTFVRAEVWNDVTGWGSGETLSSVFTQDEVNLVGNPSEPGFASHASMYLPSAFTTEIFCAEDSRVPKASIAAQFAESKENRWDRKPLRAFVSQGSKYVNSPQESIGLAGQTGRWLVTNGFFNILFQVVEEDGSTMYQADPNGFVEDRYGGYPTHVLEDACGSLRVYPDYTIDELAQADDEYKLRKSFAYGKKHIHVSEIGTASFCHHIGDRIETDGGTIWEGGHSWVVPRYAYDHIKKTENVQDPDNPGQRKDFEQFANLFFNSFTTSDDVNFKVTTEPDYDSEEFVGPMFDLSVEMEIYLMPRRWMYWMRSRESKQDINETYMATVISVKHHVDMGGAVVVSDPGSPFNGYGLNKMTEVYYNDVYLRDRACFDILSMYPNLRGGAFNVSHEFWQPDPFEGCACGCTFSFTDFQYSCGCSDATYCTCSMFDGGCIDACYTSTYHCDMNSYTYTWKMTTEGVKNHHKWGIWWDRFPNDLTVFNSSGSLGSQEVVALRTGIALFPHVTGWPWLNQYPKDWWIYGYGWDNQGLSLKGDLFWESVRNLYPGSPAGLSSFHCFNMGVFEESDVYIGGIPIVACGIAANVYVFHNHIDPVGYEWGEGYDKNGMSYDTQIITPLTCWFNHPALTLTGGGALSDPIKNLWEKIGGVEPSPWSDGLSNFGASWFYTTHGPPGYENQSEQWNLWDNIPYGVGLSPTKAEDLVGIIRTKKKDEAYYIWRRTDEVFTDVMTSVLDNYPTNMQTPEITGTTKQLSFESWGLTGYAIAGQGGNIMMPDSNGCDAGLLDQFVVTSEHTRLIEKIGLNNTRTTTENAPGACDAAWRKGVILIPDTVGNYTLHAPVFPMVSKERAIRASPACMSYDTYKDLVASTISQRYANASDPTDQAMTRFFRGTGGFRENLFEGGIPVGSDRWITYPHGTAPGPNIWMFTPKITDTTWEIATAYDSIPWHNKELRNARNPPQ